MAVDARLHRQQALHQLVVAHFQTEKGYACPVAFCCILSNT